MLHAVETKSASFIYSTEKRAISDDGIIFSYLTMKFDFKQYLPNSRLTGTSLTSIKYIKLYLQVS